MSYLVDTNVLCEPVKPRPEVRVVAWLRRNEPELYVSTVTIGEIRRGLERMPDGRRQTELYRWLQALCDAMQGRVLSFNLSTAHVWGQLKARCDGAGFLLPSLDSQIAATAQRYSLVVATRNIADFAAAGVECVNPFVEPP